MAPGRKRPAGSLSKVPSVKELCDRLGFERASPIETSVFTDTTHAFRKSYKTSSGSPGSNLIDWYSSEVQQELSAMAMNFLEQSSNGERFWSDSRRWKDSDDLTWPEDRFEIANLLKQLFWKQNKYALNNQTYGEKKYGESRDQSRDRASPPKEGTLATSANSSPRFQSTFGGSRPTPIGTFSMAPRTIPPKKPIISISDDERADVASQSRSNLPTDEVAPRNDIFDVPEDDSSSTGSRPRIDAPRYSHPVRTPDKGSPRSSSKRSPGDSPSAKRLKMSGKEGGMKYAKKSLISPKRVSSRPKAPRIRPETVPDEQIEELLKEKTPDDKSHSVDEPLSQNTGLLGFTKIPVPRDGQSLFSHTSQAPSETALGTMSTGFSESLPSLVMNRVSPSELLNNYLGGRSGSTASQPTIASPKMKDIDLPTPKDNAQRIYNHEQGHKPPKQPSSVQDKSDSEHTEQRYEKSPLAPPKPQTQMPKPTESLSRPEPPTKPKPRVRGAFWIVTSPEPNYSEESWNNGRIKGKSLSTVIGDISAITNRDHIEKLKIKLKTPFAQTTTTVHKEAEDHWEIAVSNLEEKIKDAFRKDKDQQTHFQIWIEPMYDQNAPLGGMDDVENGEIDW